MKLMDEFRKQLGKLDELRYVWMTSFNINIEFVETFILPAVLEMEIPRKRMDYELLQLALAESKMDFRVFCDRRFIGADQNKRTSIPVHGVTPSQIKDWFSKDSLFHPKVIYLEDKNGKRIIGVGSANLTIDGWGRNQEVFMYAEIDTKPQFDAVKSFFDRIADNVGISKELQIPARRGLPQAEGSWSFVHSFQDETFTEQFFYNTRSTDLLVWSPYLPRDLAGFVRRLKTTCEMDDLHVHLVPDLIEGKYIRTPFTPELQEMVASGEIAFYRHPSMPSDQVELTHAKVWKLGKHLAIGSWNFTGPGSNCLSLENGDWSNASNIEAGIIITNGNSWEEAVGKQIKVDESQFAQSKLLEDDALKIPEDLPFDIWVNFDWKEQQFSFSGRWIRGDVEEGYSLRLPCVKAPISLVWMPRKKELLIPSIRVGNPDELMLERRFQVIHHGEVVSHQLIFETELDFRRPQAYESLNDLLDAFVFGNEPGPGEDIPFCPRLLQSAAAFDNEVLVDNQEVLSAPSSTISYFRLFQATHQYGLNIDAISSPVELDKMVFGRPGCLIELIGKAGEQNTNDENRVFNWFLAQEVNLLCKKAISKKKKIGSSVSNERWVEVKIYAPELPAAINPSYVDMIREECRYANL